MTRPIDWQSVDQICIARLGRRFNECSWLELQASLDVMHRELAAKDAVLDRARAAHADAARCGCPVWAPGVAGRRDMARISVRHLPSCGRLG